MKQLLVSAALIASATPSLAADQISIMLDWFINPDHGPIIVAQQRGYFEDAGLEVNIIAPADPSDPPKMVAAGEVDLAVSYQPQLYLQHAQDLPVIRVGTLIESPLYCVMVDADGPIASLSDLAGRSVGYSVPGIEEALLHTMLRSNGVDPDSVAQINVNFALTAALAAGKVDAVSGAFRNFELHQMEAVDRKGRCFNPEDNGVPIYDELIYEANPQTMKRAEIARFLAATAKAAQDIADDPQAGWEDFRSYSSELDDSLNAAAWVDTAPHFAVQPMALDGARYTAFGSYMKDVGMIDTAPDLADIAVDLRLR
ncbi:ABC transporter ATP-binding protein [Thioclava sp. SK-1]|uniref:ABC transporter substrate-binding protein n=1 Tax=Thioclava sp. SK-1 TaxID=1889770 RepID=UPI00082615BE|nr:ABC transporter substrate-binding protein [Thioclava sp. SK-1]OCX66097.1 ABC transporter ATP-binding protein [Thioclava sp. SK-1]